MRHILTVVLIAAGCISHSPTTACGVAAEAGTAAAIERARQAVVQLNTADHRGGGAVIVAPDLILTADHCVIGLDGKNTPRQMFLMRGGEQIPLTLVEIGEFEPGAGKVADWAVMRLGKPVPADAVAVLASLTEMAEAERAVTDALDDRHVPVTAIFFPTPSPRVHPRPPLIGAGPILTSGFLKSRRAYREASLLATENALIYDDASQAPPPQFAADLDAAWFKSNAGVVQAARIYQAGGGPLFYHSADYAPGSSGAGVFFSRSAHLLGIIPWGASAVSRNAGWAEFGQAYRIDTICAQSKTMAALAGCRALSGTPGSGASPPGQSQMRPAH